ncbi:16S rRNA (uracil(1498)-N(3))-methyltransferase [Marinimicrobium sp. ABcell2]|uniref:16S rRNA (uracil(1498)-N(3))-methyltransferase n=1 Tax=Marinimicrobium sp. ABcell2 TaxID=3069751 RepID=UPI0027AE1C53|nr:16S rRNA (uracil(1498)-N(3))-methyltransferase [Marinimicrobium sp. ABcell2]MDQ2076568.1 16S rRNA (uracil(1498)-N(3))-methyltransferase [Marinimicrobium sp. ABcell2]
MRIPRIYTEQPLAQGLSLELEEGPSRHIGRVLRMQPGRELTLFNGTGGEFQARVKQVEKRSVTVQVEAYTPDNRESPLSLELAIGLSRGERMDWVLQKATELGVTRIKPLLTERTEVKLSGERLEKKFNHWRQIIISACEQCQRNLVPELAPPQKLEEWLSSNRNALSLVLHHRDSRGLPEGQAPESVALLVGPEGGLSEPEIAQAREAGCAPLTLGPRVLRTETAPVAAISLVQYRWGDFS